MREHDEPAGRPEPDDMTGAEWSRLGFDSIHFDHFDGGRGEDAAVNIPYDWDPLVPLGTPRGLDHPETYTYISGAASVRVYDGAQRRGGQDPLNYAGTGGALPPFRDGTAARFGACEKCRRYDPVMCVSVSLPWPHRRWLCVDCCPVRALPHL